MISTSTAYKTAILAYDRVFKTRITVGETVCSDENLQSISIDDNLLSSEGFSIGGTASQKLTISLIGADVNSTMPIKVEQGLLVNGAYEYIQLGIFNIDELEKKEGVTDIIAYDNMFKLETPYTPTITTTTATITAIVNDICTQAGITFSGTLPAYTVKVLDGYTKREMMGFIACLCGGNAKINRAGQLIIKTMGSSVKTITPAHCFSYKLGDSYSLSKISCKVGEETELIKGELTTASSRELKLSNPLMTDAILTSVYNTLKGYVYEGFELAWKGDASIEVGDIITITDIKGVSRQHPIFTRSFILSGGLKATEGAIAETQNSNSFESKGSFVNQVERQAVALAVVDKALITKASIADLDATKARITTLEATDATINNLIAKKANITDLTASNARIQELEASSADIDSLIAGKANITDLNASNAKITSLEADVADIDSLIAKKANITDLTASNARITSLEADVVTVENLIAEKATIADLDVIEASVISLEADMADVETLVAEKATIVNLNASNAKITTLEGNYASINNLVAKKANITDLTATNAKVTILEADVADIETILAGNITAEHIKAGTIIAGSGIIANGAIGDAQISSLNANKINAGEIDTSVVRVASKDGAIEITGNQILVNDITDLANPKNRIIIGKITKADNTTDYSILIRGADGQTVMFDSKTGITNAGITSGAIDNNKIADNANINGAKLDINSVITRYNSNGTVTISGTKIKIGEKLLDAYLSEQNTTITGHTTTLSSQSSRITATEKAIELKLSTQDYTTDKTAMEDRLEVTETSITALQGEISLKATKTEVNSAIDGVEDTVTALATRVSSAELKITDSAIVSTVRASTDYTADLKGKASQSALDTANTNITNLTTRVTSAETKITSTAIISTVTSSTTYKDALNAKASQSALDTTNSTLTALTSRVASAELKITDSAIVSTVTSSTTYKDALGAKANQSALNTTNSNLDKLVARVSTAELKITDDSIVSTVTSSTTYTEALGAKANQTALNTTNTNLATTNNSLNALNTRVTTAEQKITATAIISTVRESTAYTADLATKESNITKGTTAPASPVNNMLWLDTSTTLNVLKRYNGSAWVKATPTTASEVGAYSSTDGTALASRVSTAETKITASAIVSTVTSSTTYTADLKAKASQSALDTTNSSLTALATRVSTAELKITADAITSTVRSSTAYTTDLGAKASQSALNTTNTNLATANSNITSLTTRVNTAETSITQLNTSISLKATKDDVATAIGNIKIGGTNLFKGHQKDDEITLDVYQSVGGFTQFPYTHFTFNPADYVGKQFTVSFWAKSPNGASSIQVYNVNSAPRYFGFSKNFATLSTEWQFFEYTFANVDAGTDKTGLPKLEFYCPNKLGVLIKNIKIELGNKATDWTPAPEDVDSAINTKANQADLTALDKRVASAELKITPDSITSTVRTSTAYTTDLNAKASQTALNTTNTNLATTNTNLSNLTTRVGTAETSITQLNDSIVLKATKTEMATAITTAVKDIKIGGRNLLLESGIEVTNNSYPTKIYPLTVKPIVGQTYTISIKGTLGEGKNSFVAYNSGGTINVVSLNSANKGTDGIYRASFVWKNTNGTNTADDTTLHVYPMPSTITTESTIEWIKLEEGNKATDWNPAPEDLDDKIKAVENTLSTVVESHTASIEVFDDFITNTVSNTYTSKSDLEAYQKTVESSFKQTSQDITAKFTSSETRTSKVEGALADFKDVVETSITFDDNGITIGKSDSTFKTVTNNVKMSFTENGNEVAYISNDTMNINNAEINHSLSIGKFKFEPRTNGNLSLVWKG